MKKLLLILCAACAAWSCAPKEEAAQKRLYMWFDCEANFALSNSPDSIRFYLEKCRQAGFTDAVVDVKSIMGETVYKSEYAPFMYEWDGVPRSEEYDVLGHFIRIGHELGMRVHGSLNIFAGGHNFFDRGIIYDDHADWQSMVSTPEGIVPISTIKTNYNGMLNPADPEVRAYELDILREFATKYPEADGIIFDRARFDDITSDFSPSPSGSSSSTSAPRSPASRRTSSTGRRTTRASGSGPRVRSSAAGSSGARASSSRSSRRATPR